jgi:hypothetical protein
MILPYLDWERLAKIGGRVVLRDEVTCLVLVVMAQLDAYGKGKIVAFHLK